MLNFLIANLASIITGIIVLIIVVAVLIKIIRDKKNHKTPCGSDCAGCPMAGKCHE